MIVYDDPWKVIGPVSYLPDHFNVRRVVREETHCDYCGKKRPTGLFEYGVKHGSKVQKFFGMYCSVDCRKMAQIKEKINVHVQL